MPNNFKRLSLRLLAALAIAGMGAALTACGDEAKKDEKTSEATKTEPAKAEETKTEAAKTEEAKPAEKTDPAVTAEKTETAPAAKVVEAPKPEGTVDVAKLMEAGPLPDVFIGKADAPVTIIEYMSMTCPHCARFHNGVFDAIKEKYVDSGKVKFILREFPLDSRATAAIMLARCAQKDQYFPMVSALFKSQITWATADDGRAALLQMSRLAGFTQESFEACLTNQKLLDEVVATREKASKEYGVDSTPTFFVNGGRYTGEMTVEQMSAIIDAQ
jgi:protein-disulfide isomerase